MNVLPQDAVLILVDVQQAFNHPVWGRRNNPQAELHIAALLAAWRASDRPLIHVQHRSRRVDSLFHPDTPGFRVKPEAAPLPNEPVIYKEVNSSFIGTDLEQRLRAQGATTVVICGITTDHCVSTTTRMAGNLGFAALIVSDATATFERTGPDGRHYSAELMHNTALASLHEEFAQVVDTATVLAALAVKPDAD
ncbi:cysteine hydrolase family protein [Pseudoduganella ginsengisoli]|uniref:Isochorismatase family protein n=1 Tax=Pseudoduganella ginsengisoli TaxID=1462440 RepID=A0A6L6PUK8_9BURK|nr:cysteine hydrolase family protein [Pseudoduganella ginsengisoli]MTW00929.1 isochorismatase family protein [Pseudoduganella ginsengisoli]